MNYSRLDLLPPFSADAMIRGASSPSQLLTGAEGGRIGICIVEGRRGGSTCTWARRRRRRKRDDLIVSRGGKGRGRDQGGNN